MPARGLSLLLILLAAGCAAVPPPAPPPPRQAWLVAERREAVVAGAAGPTGARLLGLALFDGPGRRVFLTDAGGRVHGVELDTGRVLFASEVTGAPIAVLPGGAIAVLTPERRVVLVDRDDGTPLFASGAGALAPASAWAITRLEQPPGQLRLHWSVTTSPNLACCGGGQPTTTSGVETLDLATGELLSRQAAPVPGRSFEAQEPFELPPGVHATLPTGVPVWTGAVGQLPRSLQVTIDGGATWSHPAPPARVEAPRPEASQRRQ